MNALIRLVSLTFIAISFCSLASAQETPPNDGTPPDGGIPPDIEVPDLPTDLTPPNFSVRMSPPLDGGDSEVSIIFFPDAGSTGAFETSSDLVNWTPMGVPTLQSGDPVFHDHAIVAGEKLYIRWAVSAP